MITDLQLRSLTSCTQQQQRQRQPYAIIVVAVAIVVVVDVIVVVAVVVVVVEMIESRGTTIISDTTAVQRMKSPERYGH